MPEYLAPGVYVEEIDTGSKPIEGVSTSTAGMIGVTERGPVNVPILVTGIGEYTRWFGERLNILDYSDSVTGAHCYLPHAVEGFFTNGGKRVYITRVLDTDLADRSAAMLFNRGTPPFGSTVLLRAARENTGTAANPPLLVVLSGTNIAQNDWVRIGDGSDSEYRQVSAALAAETVLIPLNLPFSRSHGAANLDQFNRTAAGGALTIFVDPAVGTATRRGDVEIEVNGAAGDISALAANGLLEIGANANVAEHRFIAQVTPILATRARVRLDSPLGMAYPNGAGVQRLTLGAGPPTAQIDTVARAGESLIVVVNRPAGQFNNRARLVVVDTGNNAEREVRRIGEMRQVTITPGAADVYPAGSLVEGVALVDDSTLQLTADPALGATVLSVNDISTLSVGQTILVGAAPNQENAVVQSLAPGVAPAGDVTLAAGATIDHPNNAPVVAVRALMADAAAGASFLALSNRMGLQIGDVLRVGAGADEEFAAILGLPNRAPAGVRPDAGNVILAAPLVRSHPRATTQVVRQNAPTVANVQPTVLILGAAAGTDTLLLSDGAGYTPPGIGFVRLTTATGVFYHRNAALSAALAPQAVTLNAALDLAHPVGAPVVERRSLLNVQALDAGRWGNRLRVSVEDEPAGLVAGTTIANITNPTRMRLASAAGVEAGTILEFVDATGAVVGDPVKVVSLDRATNDITLSAPGLAPTQVVGLGARSREFRLTVILLRQPDPLMPARNDTVLDSEVFRYLSMDPRHSRYVQTVVGDIVGPLRLSDHRPEGESWYVRVRDVAQDLAEPARTTALESIRVGPEALTDILPDGRVRPARHPLRGGDDSIATLTDATYIGLDDPNPEDRTGLHSLRNVEEISIIAAPGRTSVTMQNALINQCELMRYRFAVLDALRPPQDTLADVQNQRQQFDTKYAALYHPWLLIPDPYPTSMARIQEFPLPPSGHIVGVYARTDIERGVHKAPANEVVNGIVGLQRVLNKEQQDILNPYPVNINVIRDFRPNNRGIRVFGGRVITSDSDFKYVNVRRLLIFIEASIDRGLQWVVFEPNAEPLWARVRRSISNFLTLVWRNGALEGTKVEEAYFVKCDRTTMTQTDIDQGRLICVVGVAPVKPAEFVIIRIGLWTAHAEE